MTTVKQTLSNVIAHLENHLVDGYPKSADVLNECKEALAEVEKCEPVAYADGSNLDLCPSIPTTFIFQACNERTPVFDTPLYTAPQPRDGEPDAEVSHVDVLPDSNGMYEHRFLFNDRLCTQTELYLYNPNKPRAWVGLSEQEISLMAFNDYIGDWSNLKYKTCWKEGYIDGAKATEAKLRDINTKG